MLWNECSRRRGSAGPCVAQVGWTLSGSADRSEPVVVRRCGVVASSVRRSRMMRDSSRETCTWVTLSTPKMTIVVPTPHAIRGFAPDRSRHAGGRHGRRHTGRCGHHRHPPMREPWRVPTGAPRNDPGPGARHLRLPRFAGRGITALPGVRRPQSSSTTPSTPRGESSPSTASEGPSPAGRGRP